MCYYLNVKFQGQRFVNVSSRWRPVITIKNIFLQKQVAYETQYLRNINSTAVTYLKLKLIYEPLDNVFEGSDINIAFEQFSEHLSKIVVK